MLLLFYAKLVSKNSELEPIFIYFLLTNQVFVLVAVHVEVLGKALRSFFYLLIHELQMN